MRLRQYLSPAFCWTVIILVVLALLLRSSISLQCWLLRHNTPGVLAPYLYNTYQLRRQGYSVKLLILGDSVPMMAVAAPQLAQALGLQPEEVFNFSHGGAGPASHLYNFKKFQPYLPNLRSVILFVQYKRLNKALAQAQTMAEDLLRTEDHPFRRAWQTASLSPIFHSYSRLLQLTPLIVWHGVQPFPGFRPRPGGGTTMDNVIPAPPTIPGQDPWQPNQQAREDLYNLLLTLKQNGLTVRAYLIPYHPQFYQAWLGGEEEQAGRRLFQQFAEAGLLEFFPDAFSGLAGKLQPYYLDLWHLTPAGAALFTNALARHLQAYPLPGVDAPMALESHPKDQ